MRAILRHYRQSPRKVRLVVDCIRGKEVPRARLLLDALPKRAAAPIKKLLDSAVANARENAGVADDKNLYVKEARVDEGVTLKRIMPRARGSAYIVRKRTSRVLLTLDEKEKEPVEAAKLDDAEKKAAQAPAAKAEKQSATGAQR